jgi:hypothetical protein
MAEYRLEPSETRRVRFTAAGRNRVGVLYGVLSILALMQAWAISRAISNAIFGPKFLIPPLFVLFGAFMIRSLMSNERELLQTGSVATGRVTEVANSPKGNMVSFVYQDTAGAAHERTARDITGRLTMEDAVTVFYDPKRPGRSVINPGNFYEVM